MLRYSTFLHTHILMQLNNGAKNDVVFGVFLRKPSTLELAKLINYRADGIVSKEDIEESLIKSIDENVFTVNGTTYEVVETTLIEN